MLVSLALSPLVASSPLDDLEIILNNYEEITKSLVDNSNKQEERLNNLELSISLMKPVIDSLELTWTMRQKTLDSLESQTATMQTILTSSQKTIDDLERGLKATENSLKLWKTVANVSIGIGIAGLAVGIISIVIK